MSTEIKSVFRPEWQTFELGNLIGYDESPRIFIRVDENRYEKALINLSRADFIAAVEKELNVKIIEKSDYPEIKWIEGSNPNGFVTTATHPVGVTSGYLMNTPERNRSQAIAHLAAADFIEAEKNSEVNQLADLLRQANDETSWTDTARALLATGKVELKP